jgi:ribokinase
MIWVDRHGQNSIVVASGANHALASADVEAMRPVFRGASLALFQLETRLDTVSAALALARQENLRTMLDPAPAQPLPSGLLASVDILTPNESEAHMLLGRPPTCVAPEDAPELARALQKLGPRTIVLKLGDQGSFYADDSDGFHTPVFAVQARDTTAAGDTFNAALAVALAEGQPPQQAMRFASAAAAISVTRLGAQSSAPARAEVDQLLKQ